MKPRSYKVPKLKIMVKTGDPWGEFRWADSHFRTSASPISVIPAKKKMILLKLNIPKITLKVPLGQHTFNRKQLS